jgi:tRNA/rRNA methyltransferase/tRNA (cytidine32/uridine32-2'-O)-methyltransferase
MIVVVLHETQELVNVAHVVRAMKNFGVADLRLVSPLEYDPYRIEGIAHRSADVLERARLFDDLDAALADCVHVAGFSARERTAKRSAQRPREAAAEALARSAEGTVALLFGREDKGLSNEALDRCHRVVAIPSDPAYASLNLGHAVTVALYELAVARGDDARPFKPPRRRSPPATGDDLERLFVEAERALTTIGFFKSHVAEQVMRTLRDVAHRAPLDEREAKLLRAMAIEVARDAAGRRGRPPRED